MHPFELNPTFAFTLLGTFFIYMWTRPPRWTLIPVLIIAGCTRILCIRMNGGVGDYYGVRWISWGAFLGIGVLIVLAGQVVWSHGPAKKSYLRTFYSGAVFPMLALVDGYSVPLNIWLRPKTYDAFLLAFDGSLGFQPSFMLGQFLLQNPTARNLTTIMYYALPLTVCMVYASDRMQIQKPVAILVLFLTFTILGFAQYSMYPAVGPRYAFAGMYPQAPHWPRSSWVDGGSRQSAQLHAFHPPGSCSAGLVELAPLAALGKTAGWAVCAGHRLRNVGVRGALPCRPDRRISIRIDLPISVYNIGALVRTSSPKFFLHRDFPDRTVAVLVALWSEIVRGVLIFLLGLLLVTVAWSIMLERDLAAAALGSRT